MRIVISILILCFLLKSNDAFGSCFQTLSKLSNPTEDLISYLTLLLDQRTITGEEISRFAANLQNGHLTNPIPENQNQTNSTAHIHRGEIQKKMESPLLDVKLLLQWANSALENKLRVRVARDEAQAKTEDPYLKIQFQPIPKGKYKIFSKDFEVAAFEMMSTPITQKQWVDVMGENPAFFYDGPEAIRVYLKGRTVMMQPDNPVERVNWWAAVYFANQLSIKAGLKPAYDLSDVNFSANEPARGYMSSNRGVLRINAPNEDIYQTEGYRLPTKIEREYLWKFMATKPNHTNTWGAGNSNSSTQPVAKLPPILVNGLPFYDLYGNVVEWCHDTNAEKPRERLTFGGSWRDAEFTFPEYWDGEGNYNSYTGFRLVRSLK